MLEVATHRRGSAEEESRVQIALENLEPVVVNGVVIDFAVQEFIKRGFRPIGLNVRIDPDRIFLRWLRPDTLGWFQGIECNTLWSHGFYSKYEAYDGLELRKGESISLVDVKCIKNSDKTLNWTDRESATATTLAVRRDGSTEYGGIITFASSLFLGNGVTPFLVDPTVAKFDHRLRNLRSHYPPSVSCAKINNSQQEARRRHLLWENQRKSLSAQLEMFGIQKDTIRRLEIEIDAAHDSAAAFGYAVASAESESTSRPVARLTNKRITSGGKAAGKLKKQKADVWKTLVLPWAIEMDRCEGECWSRNEFARRIEEKFVGEVPLFEQIRLWLKNEAEEPSGPLRKRRKGKSQPEM